MTTPAYMAPEMIFQKQSTTKVDMWALGVILYQLFSNKLPFEAASYFETMKLISEGEPAPLPLSISPFIKEIITNLLCKDPETRPDT
jgi:serine/threonine protein kinase